MIKDGTERIDVAKATDSRIGSSRGDEALIDFRFWISNFDFRIPHSALRIRLSSATAGYLLRRHVVWRPKQVACQSQIHARVQALRQPEIGHARLIGGVDENVRRFEVTMQN